MPNPMPVLIEVSRFLTAAVTHHGRRLKLARGHEILDQFVNRFQRFAARKSGNNLRFA